MKRYKYAIQIDLNITDIMLLPCVVSCEKSVIEHHVMGGDSIKTANLTYTLFDGQTARYGDWLVKDVCDHWEVMTDNEYKKHINDTL